jgi:hypothetical protein
MITAAWYYLDKDKTNRFHANEGKKWRYGIQLQNRVY